MISKPLERTARLKKKKKKKLEKKGGWEEREYLLTP